MDSQGEILQDAQSRDPQSSIPLTNTTAEYETENEHRLQVLEEKVLKIEVMVTALQSMVMQLCEKADIFSGGPASAYWTVRDDAV